MQSREIMLPPRIIKVHPAIEPHKTKHRVALADILPTTLQRLLHLWYSNARPQLNVTQVKRYSRREEVLQRHLVYAFATRAEVLEGVDVCSRVVGHCEGV